MDPSYHFVVRHSGAWAERVACTTILYALAYRVVLDPADAITDRQRSLDLVASLAGRLKP